MRRIKIKHPRHPKKKKKLAITVLLLVVVIVGCLVMIKVRQPTVVSPVPPVTASSQQTNKSGQSDTKRLAEILQKSDIPVENIDRHDDSSYRVTLQTEQEVIFSSQKTYDAQVSSLQLLLSRLTIEGKRISRIDLRYDNPVVVFN